MHVERTPEEQAHGITLNLCCFCGAQNAVPQAHLDMATKLGERMAKTNTSLVFGGGDCGLMGAVSNAVMAHGGYVTGVFPESLRHIEREHPHISKSIIVDTMHTRKELMYKKSDVFAILPGGFGTMDEMFEILTWKQIQLHNKPVVIVNHQGYWDHLIALMDNIIATGFARRETRGLYDVVDNVDALMAYLAPYHQ